MVRTQSEVDSNTHHGKPFDADVILEHLGNTGWFQFRYFICLAFAVLFPTASILVFSFTGATPAHRCFVEGCDSETNPLFIADWMDNSTVSSLLNDPLKWICNFPEEAILLDCATANKTTVCNNWIFDKTIFSSTIVTDFRLVCKDSWKTTFASSLTMMGVMVGAFLLGPLPDVIGRRKSVLILSIWMSVFGIALSFSKSYEQFAALRFLNGMGCIALMQALAIWGVEAMAPAVRVKFIFIIYCFQSMGNLLTGLLAYFVRDWPTLQLYLFIPMVLTITYFFILPESTRWLTVNKNYVEAKNIYEKAAKMNNRKIPPHLLEIPCENLTAPDASKHISHLSTDTADKDANAWNSTWHVLKTPCLFRRLLILFCTWASGMLSYYGLSYSASNLSDNVHLNFILVILVEIPAYLVGMFAVDFLGRRIIINLTLIIGGLFCLLAGIVPQEQYALIVSFSLIGKFFISMQIVTVNMITAEVFPTASRGVTIGLCSTVGKIGGILAPIMSSMGARNRSLPYIVFGTINLMVGMLTLMLPETKGLAMPATLQEAKELEAKTLDIFGLRKRKQQESTATLNISTYSV